METIEGREKRTLHEIHAAVGGDLGGALSARVRDLRKQKYGGFDVRCEPNSETGLWEYWIQS